MIAPRVVGVGVRPRRVGMIAFNREQIDVHQIGRNVMRAPLCAQCLTRMFIVRGEPSTSWMMAYVGRLPVPQLRTPRAISFVKWAYGRETNRAIVRIGARRCIRSWPGVECDGNDRPVNCLARKKLLAGSR